MIYLVDTNNDVYINKNHNFDIYYPVEVIGYVKVVNKVSNIETIINFDVVPLLGKRYFIINIPTTNIETGWSTYEIFIDDELYTNGLLFRKFDEDDTLIINNDADDILVL